MDTTCRVPTRGNPATKSKSHFRTPHPAPRTPHPAPRTPHPAPRTPHYLPVSHTRCFSSGMINLSMASLTALVEPGVEKMKVPR